MKNKIIWWGLSLLLGSNVWGKDASPRIGYAFPAGGQHNQIVEVIVGGQHLQNASHVLISGKGVSVEIQNYSVKYDPKQLNQFYRSKKNTQAELKEKTGDDRKKLERRIEQIDNKLAVAEFPEGMDPSDKKQVQKYYRGKKKDQFNPQLSELLHLRITIAPTAPPGVRELRISTPAGLSNPLYFEVNTLQEAIEIEPNDDHMNAALQQVTLPCIVNGQILPGDIDHIRFEATKDQNILIEVHARKIIPYLADAVPGWFQSVISLQNAEGKEVAYQDDYKFSPDPVLCFKVPATGLYTLSIKDAIYRGREDFIYRIIIGELPFITSIFPLGAEQGKEVSITLTGENLPTDHVSGKTPKEPFEVQQISLKKENYRSNTMPFAIGDLTEQLENEPNSTQAQAESIQYPLTINGRINPAGDIDRFRFHGEKGDHISFEIMARRLNSPLDSTLTITGPGITEPIRNDDFVIEESGFLFLGAGLITHHADSRLSYKLPATGTYFIELRDAQSKGGPDYAYRLMVRKAQPNFKLYIEPSGQPVAPGGTIVFTARAIRSDGCTQPIHIQCTHLPEGFSMSTAYIQENDNITRFTITAEKTISEQTFSPEITGTARVGTNSITHTAAPVDDQMQAYLYRHLVPAKNLTLATASNTAAVSFEVILPPSGIIRLPLGETIKLRLKGSFEKKVKHAKIQLDHPPEGINMGKSWIGKPKNPKKNERNSAVGSIEITAKAPLKVGDHFPLIVTANVKQGKTTTSYPAPSISVKVVPPRK